jgi:hypothetical protein
MTRGVATPAPQECETACVLEVTPGHCCNIMLHFALLYHVRTR